MGHSSRHLNETTLSLVVTLTGEVKDGAVRTFYKIFNNEAVVIKCGDIYTLDFDLGGVDDIPLYVRHISQTLDDHRTETGLEFKFARIG